MKEYGEPCSCIMGNWIGSGLGVSEEVMFVVCVCVYVRAYKVKAEGQQHKTPEMFLLVAIQS